MEKKPKATRKPLFSACLARIPEALQWADAQKIDTLQDFLLNEPSRPLLSFANGGSFSPSDYATLLYEQQAGLAKAITPLQAASLSDAVLQQAKLLVWSSSGKGVDEEFLWKRLANNQRNPSITNCLAVVSTVDEKNKLVEHLTKAGSHYVQYVWPKLERSFIASIDVLSKYALLYRCFHQGASVCQALAGGVLQGNEPDTFTYGPRVEGEVPALGSIRHFVALYNGWSRPVALDFESRMVEAGLASVQLCDYRNFCHGRFIFPSNHPEDTAIVLFVTPTERAYINNLFNGKDWHHPEVDVFPAQLPMLTVSTEFNGPLASVDLLQKMLVMFSRVADAFGENPAAPKNKSSIDKRFPRNVAFKVPETAADAPQTKTTPQSKTSNQRTRK